MRTLGYALIAVLMTETPALAQAVQETIAEHCSERWPADARMEVYCREKQMEAAFRVKEMLAEGDRDEPFKDRCIGKWLTDYAMMAYCFEKQIEAAGELADMIKAVEPFESHPRHVTAFSKCHGKWDPDIAMTAYCVRQEFDALDQLGVD